jgi:hypothetical protein
MVHGSMAFRRVIFVHTVHTPNRSLVCPVITQQMLSVREQFHSHAWISYFSTTRSATGSFVLILAAQSTGMATILSWLKSWRHSKCVAHQYIVQFIHFPSKIFKVPDTYFSM